MSDLRDEKIERIERKILRSNRVSRETLREIVADPQFYDRLSARIRAEALQRKTAAPASERWLTFFRNWQRIGAFGGALAFLLTTAGLIFFTKTDSPLSEIGAPPPAAQTPLTTMEKPQAPVARLSEEGRRADDGIDENDDQPHKIAFKKRAAKITVRAAASKRKPRFEDEKDEEFYPLAFAGNLRETETGGQIIRVELSRSSLLALGLEPPMDDETVKIKTELLVGSDGVARGVRFVK